MKKSVKLLVGSLIAALALSLGGVTNALAGDPSCQVRVWKSDNGKVSTTKVWAGTCPRNVQARAMRYYGGQPHWSDGARARYSVAVKGNGTGAGHYFRIQTRSGSWGPWNRF